MWKSIGIVIGVLIVAFFALGFIKPEIQVASSTAIGRSPEVVWKVFTDRPRTKQWLTGLESMETISGAHLAVGSHHRLTFREGNRWIEMDEVVTAVEPGKLYAFNSSMDVMKGSTYVRLAPKDGGTELAFESIYGGRSMFWRSILVVMQGTIARREAEDLAKLKALVQAEPQ
jgi:uncharacterized protein YndB with AHSA1/START domain